MGGQKVTYLEVPLVGLGDLGVAGREETGLDEGPDLRDGPGGARRLALEGLSAVREGALVRVKDGGANGVATDGTL